MQTFHVKTFNTGSFLKILLPLLLLILVVPFFIFDTMKILNFLTSTPGIFTLIACIILPAVLLRQLFFSSMEVISNDSVLTIKNNKTQQQQLALKDLSFIKYLNTQKPVTYHVYNQEPKKIFSFSEVKNTDAEKLLKYLKEKCSLIEASTTAKGIASPALPVLATKEALQQGVLASVDKMQGSSKKRNSLIIAGIVGVILFASVIPFFINKKAFYDTKEGKVYFGNKELTSIKKDEFTTMSYNVAKDCTHIYYRGEPVNFVDHKTFRELGNNMFYADKNGLYYETNSLYSKTKLKPLEGDYDRSSFHEIGGSNYYKDKNNLYTISIFGDKPLKQIDIKGLDVATIDQLNSIWFADKNAIYFVSYDDIKLCKEIDRSSFEILSARVAKDKNHVYYLTYDLKSDEHRSSDKMDNYAVLEKADAPTFTLVSDNEFVDKNTTWTISKEGEKVEYRDGKSGSE